MAPAFLTAVVVCLFLSTLSLFYIALESRRLRTHITRTMPGYAVPSASNALDYGKYGVGVMRSPAGYAIYVYRQGRWELESDLSAPGYEPSAPSIPGAYESQVIKKESRPVS